MATVTVGYIVDEGDEYRPRIVDGTHGPIGVVYLVTRTHAAIQSESPGALRALAAALTDAADQLDALTPAAVA